MYTSPTVAGLACTPTTGLNTLAARSGSCRVCVRYRRRRKVIAKGATAVPNPKNESVNPITLRFLASISNPQANSKVPRATIPIAIGFIVFYPPIVVHVQAVMADR